MYFTVFYLYNMNHSIDFVHPSQMQFEKYIQDFQWTDTDGKSKIFTR